MDDAAQEWTGESVRHLASTGRLALTAHDVEQALGRLEETLSTVHGYLDDLHQARAIGPSGFTADVLSQDVIDLCVAEMGRPGQLARSLDELSKYAEALRLAATLSAEKP